MINHVSFNAHDPAGVAAALGEILGGVPIASPSPPFEHGSMFLCFFDDDGSMFEISPFGTAYRRGAEEATSFESEPAMTETAGCHINITSPVPLEEIEAICARVGWPCGLVDNGPFKVFNIWVEGRYLIEVMAPSMLADYLATFGPGNREALDGQLRGLETFLRQMGAAHPNQLTAPAQ